MTGIERLHGIAKASRGYSWAQSLGYTLEDIAQQIEREQDEQNHIRVMSGLKDLEYVYVLMVYKSLLIKPALAPATAGAATEYGMEYELYPHAASDSPELLSEIGKRLVERYGRGVITNFQVVPAIFHKSNSEEDQA